MALNIKDLIKRAKESSSSRPRRLSPALVLQSYFICLDEKTSCCMSALLTKRSLRGGS